MVALVGLFLLLNAPGASAGTYTVHECHPSSRGTPDVVAEGGAIGYTESNGCATGDYLQIGSTAAVVNAASRQYVFRAPEGTRMNDAGVDYYFAGTGGGNQEYLFLRRVGQAPTYYYNTGPDSTSTGHYSTAWNGGPVDEVGIGMVCGNGGGCARQGGAFVRLSNLAFSMEDTVTPDTPSTSGSALGGWVNGTKSISANLADTGAGVASGASGVNGTLTSLSSYCSADVDSTGAAKKMKPCPGSASDSHSYNVAASPFVQGDNAVQTCVYDYGNNPGLACKTDTVKVDTIAPTAPTSLAVAGGEGWKRDNDFDLSWSNPAQAHAPIVGAEVRMTGPSGYDQTTYYAGAGKSSIDNVSVPAKGDYTASVYLKDAAGNETPANVSSVHLRFDNTVPAPKEPEKANGWISRAELAGGYRQAWQATTQQETPPSGIAGYRVVVNANSDSDPCSGATDPRACGAPITEAGADNLSRTLQTGDLAEGANYVHVVPVSGSGMRATDVKHTPLRADFTDPVTVLQGDRNGAWINHDANLTAVGADAPSGMVDTDEYPDDDPPATFLVVDGAQMSSTGASVSQVVSGEGSHEVKFWARDLAGNTATVSTKTVRIDKTAPSVAFTNSQDSDDPDKLVAPASDALSGVTDGKISYRQDGSDSWKALDTALRDGNLVARVDSGDLKPGVTYEFQAVANDLAGNTATSRSKQNGDPMKVTGPFRTITGVVDLKINGKAEGRITYGKQAKVTGELVTDVGAKPVGNASVELQQSYGVGSKKRTETIAVSTDGQGGFSAKLPKGPSRTVIADYKGDRRYLGTHSASAKLGVRSKVSMKVPKQVSSKKGITFKGKIKAKGAKLGKRGKRLEIQVHVGKRWKTVGKSFRSNKKGKFKLPYKFTADYPHAVTFEFRAAVLKERGFPYLPSKSTKRKVTVTP